jgi:hypothetical protein
MKRAALLAGLLLAVGCGHTRSTTTNACAQAGGTGAKSNPTRPSKTMLLTAVRVDSDSCSDRVIFDFSRDSAQKPAFRAEYRPAKEAQTEDASGRHLPIAGKAFLVVRFDPASGADLSGSKVVRTYKGPRRLKPPGMRSVREIVETGDFEAVLTWAIGLSGRRPFTVESSSSPPRLTIELG